MLRLGTHSISLVVGALLVSTAPVLLQQTTAIAEELQPIVVDVPRADRAMPRDVDLLGIAGDHVVMSREVGGTPTSSSHETVIVDAAGNAERTGRAISRVFGQRLVASATFDAALVATRELPSSDWVDVAIPEGHRLHAAVRPGLLLRDPDGDLSLLPWSGGDPQPLTGVPAGIRAGQVIANDGDTVLLTASNAQLLEADPVLVDVGTLRAWQVDVSPHPAYAANDGQVGWIDGAVGPTPVIRTLHVPAEGDDAQPSITSRSVTTADLAELGSFPTVLPVGSDVVVARRDVTADNWNAGQAAPVRRVSPEGTVTDLAVWGHNIVPAGDGIVAFVAASHSSTAAVRAIDLRSGTVSSVARITPVPAWVSALSVDGSDAYLVDNSAKGDSVVRESVAFSSGGSTRATLDSAVTDVPCAEFFPSTPCIDVASERGNAAWNVRVEGGRLGRIEPGGAARRTNHSAGLPLGITGPRVLLSSARVLDTGTGVISQVARRGHPASLTDGVLYVPGAEVANAPRGAVIARDVVTRRASLIPVAGCAAVTSVQAAGTWILAACALTSGGDGVVVVDRTGAIDPRVLPAGHLVLGNGFVLRRTANDLHWQSLASGAADWRFLGKVDRDYRAQPLVEASSTAATAAWVEGHRVRVASLPVTVTGPAVKPTAVPLPHPPVMTLKPRDGSLRATWTDPDVAEGVSGYEARIAYGRAQSLPAETRMHEFTGLENGRDYSVDVTAENLAGWATTSVRATPAIPPPGPPEPTNVRATVDRLTSRVTVTWDWTADEDREQAQGFHVSTANGSHDVSADARSVSYVAPVANPDHIYVYAVGTATSNSATPVEIWAPGLDTKSPTSDIRGLVAATLASSFRFTAVGADDRQIKSVDVRWRQAAFGKLPGSWSQPSTWQNRTTGTTITTPRLTAGNTYCFSSRARDHVGNLSAWTAEKCTSVALDDRALSRVGDVRTVKGTGYFNGTATRIFGTRARLVRDNVRIRHVWVVATTCPTCGSIAIRTTVSQNMAIVSLRSAVRRDRQLIRVPWDATTYGPIRIERWGTRATGPIDGVVLRGF